MIQKLGKGKRQEAEVMAAVRKMRLQGTIEREAADTEKVGVPTGCHVVNPVNGEKVPLWVANFALMTYGTGAVMSVPGHDQRDFEFAKKYGLPIRVVISPADEDLDPDTMPAAFVHDGLPVNSAQFDGMPTRTAIPALGQSLQDIGQLGARACASVRGHCRLRSGFQRVEDRLRGRVRHIDDHPTFVHPLDRLPSKRGKSRLCGVFLLRLRGSEFVCHRPVELNVA